jgi:hypothetical protein
MVRQLRQQFYQEVLGLSYSYGGEQTSFRGASVCASIETCQDRICTSWKTVQRNVQREFARRW